MSKVNYYLDSKRKALHRQRRYETAHKKQSRARSYEKGEYYYWGYCVERQREIVDYTWVKTPRGTSICVPHFEKIGGEVFIVSRISKNAKYLKRTAAKKWRKHRINYDSFADRGCTYKKDYDIPWTLL
ncbi:MAG: hypothetical protein K6D93_02155 [Saccharofermentans sp.]|nr:hypothetical protein [Saccharofermentans sp.]